MEKISRHITYTEAVASSTAERMGVDNTPDADTLEVMKLTATRLFDPVRDHFGCRIAVTSFYRSPKINASLAKDAKIMASKKSQHMSGEAMDINGRVYGGVTNREIFEFIRANLDFDQLIWEEGSDLEPSWVHVSCRKNIEANRHEVLRKQSLNGKVIYTRI